MPTVSAIAGDKLRTTDATAAPIADISLDFLIVALQLWTLNNKRAGRMPCHPHATAVAIDRKSSHSASPLGTRIIQ